MSVAGGRGGSAQGARIGSERIAGKVQRQVCRVQDRRTADKLKYNRGLWVVVVRRHTEYGVLIRDRRVSRAGRERDWPELFLGCSQNAGVRLTGESGEAEGRGYQGMTDPIRAGLSAERAYSALPLVLQTRACIGWGKMGRGLTRCQTSTTMT